MHLIRDRLDLSTIYALIKKFSFVTVRTPPPYWDKLPGARFPWIDPSHRIGKPRRTMRMSPMDFSRHSFTSRYRCIHQRSGYLQNDVYIDLELRPFKHLHLPINTSPGIFFRREIFPPLKQLLILKRHLIPFRKRNPLVCLPDPFPLFSQQGPFPQLPLSFLRT